MCAFHLLLTQNVSTWLLPTTPGVEASSQFLSLHPPRPLPSPLPVCAEASWVPLVWGGALWLISSFSTIELYMLSLSIYLFLIAAVTSGSSPGTF